MSKFTLQITPSVRSILERCAINGNALILPSGRLERKDYQEVNARIEAAGGKWNKKAQGHVFASDPKDALAAMLATGVVKDEAKAKKVERQAFYTPQDAARTVAIFADVAGHIVLEPSAGHGALAYACEWAFAHTVECMEIDKDACKALKKHFAVLHEGDFLETTPDEAVQRYSRIVMNPPFTRKSDAKHIRHAFNHWLKLDGLLTAIVADDGKDRPDIAAYSNSFKVVHRFPKGMFRESGTEIATLVIQLIK